MWLSDLEWACCGDPFRVGDEVDFGVASRDVTWLRENFGEAIARTVDALESHHEEEWPDRVRGRVTAAYSVTVDTLERRIDRELPPERPRFMLSGTDTGTGVGTGVWAGGPTRSFTVEATWLPDSAKLVPVERIGATMDERSAALLADPAPTDRNPADRDPAEFDPLRERHVRRSAGWIVDVTP